MQLGPSPKRERTPLRMVDFFVNNFKYYQLVGSFKCFCYNSFMQKIATKVFIIASVVFGVIGILIVLTASGPDTPDSRLSEILIRLLFADVFVILPSFALSLAGKYLNN